MINKTLISMTAVALLFGTAISNVYANKPSSVISGVIFHDEAPAPTTETPAPTTEAPAPTDEGKPAEEAK